MFHTFCKSPLVSLKGKLIASFRLNQKEETLSDSHDSIVKTEDLILLKLFDVYHFRIHFELHPASWLLRESFKGNERGNVKGKFCVKTAIS